MPKFRVTPNMGAALRNLRQKRNFKAIDVANAINKTGAYISKLEKGVLNTIEENDLIHIIHTLSKNEEEFNEGIQLLLKDTTIEYSKEEAEEKEWRLNLDLFYRKLPIPSQYLSIAKEKIESLNITIKELADYINSNYDLYNDDSFPNDMLDKADKNHWYFNNGHSFIVVNVSENDLKTVLYTEGISTNYSMLMCILVSLLRLEKIPHDEAYQQAYQILSELKIQTLSEKESIMQTYDKIDEMHSILDQRENEGLPEADRQLLTSLYDFTKAINSFAVIHDIDYANKRLSTMLDNFTNDPILFMGYIGVDLSKLKNCDFQIKKEFVNAVRELAEEYSIRKPKEERQELI